MFKRQHFSIKQAKNTAKDLQNQLKTSSKDETLRRMLILPEYSSLAIDDLKGKDIRYAKCLEVIAKENGFNNWKEVTEKYFWQLLKFDDLFKALKNYPMVTPNGYGGYDDRDGLITYDTRFLSKQHKELKDHLRGFQLACLWLKYQTKIQSINRKIGTYQLKHDVERWANNISLPEPYVSQGAFIAAALHMGFRLSSSIGYLSCSINISSRLKNPDY